MIRHTLLDLVAFPRFWKWKARRQCHWSIRPCQYVDFANCNHGDSLFQWYNERKVRKSIQRGIEDTRAGRTSSYDWTDPDD